MKRKELLIKLLNMDEPVEILNIELAKFGWDSNEDLVTLNRQHILKAINKFLKGKISGSEIESWANAIECREDIGFEEGYYEIISDTIFKLANPNVAENLSQAKARALFNKLL